MDQQQIRHLRRRILEISHRSNSYHIGSCLSCVELVAVCFEQRISHKSTTPLSKLLLSKGHAAMTLYAVAEHFGMIQKNWLDQYLQNDSKLWGHVTMDEEIPIIDWSTGSLGHGLAAAAAMAYSALKLKNTKGITAVILSDGECNEGSTWEAALFAGHHQLHNLIAIIDYNKIQSFGFCKDIASLEPFAAKWNSFGWKTQEIDGHDLQAIQDSLLLASQSTQPTCIVAHTVKGKGLPSIENTLQSHYRAASQEHLLEIELHKT